MIAFF